MSASRATHRVTLYPGERLDVRFVEKLPNGYPDEEGRVEIEWQERDASPGEIATKGREVHVDVMLDHGRTGPTRVIYP